MNPTEVRQVKFDEYASDKSLIHAAEQAHARNYKDFLIVDVDSHHYENENYRDVFEYIDNPVIKRGALESIQRPLAVPPIRRPTLHMNSEDPPTRTYPTGHPNRTDAPR